MPMMFIVNNFNSFIQITYHRDGFLIVLRSVCFE